MLQIHITLYYSFDTCKKIKHTKQLLQHKQYKIHITVGNHIHTLAKIIYQRTQSRIKNVKSTKQFEKQSKILIRNVH